MRANAEPIEMLEKRFSYFPRVFLWRGQRYEVQRVERCWTVSHRGWKRSVQQLRFRVRCGEETFEVYQDLKTNTWHIEV